jgi:hypothetical protein
MIKGRILISTAIRIFQFFYKLENLLVIILSNEIREIRVRSIRGRRRLGFSCHGVDVISLVRLAVAVVHGPAYSSDLYEYPALEVRNGLVVVKDVNEYRLFVELSLESKYVLTFQWEVRTDIAH